MSPLTNQRQTWVPCYRSSKAREDEIPWLIPFKGSRYSTRGRRQQGELGVFCLEPVREMYLAYRKPYTSRCCVVQNSMDAADKVGHISRPDWQCWKPKRPMTRLHTHVLQRDWSRSIVSLFRSTLIFAPNRLLSPCLIVSMLQLPSHRHDVDDIPSPFIQPAPISPCLPTPFRTFYTAHYPCLTSPATPHRLQS